MSVFQFLTICIPTYRYQADLLLNMTIGPHQLRIHRELNKLHNERQRIDNRLRANLEKERNFVERLASLEFNAFRTGDYVMIENAVPLKMARVRFTRKDKTGLFWVYLTTVDGIKTRRVPRNLTKMPNP